MPFEPLSSVRIADFLSGGFVGDGGEGADRLWQVSSRDGFVSETVFSNGVWVGAADGSASSARVRAGDALVFRPGLDDPTELCVFGRVHSSVDQTATLFPGLNLLSWGYPSVITSFPEFPKGVDGLMDVEGRPLPVAALPWWSAFWVTNANASVVRLERPRSCDVPA